MAVIFVTKPQYGSNLRMIERFDRIRLHDALRVAA
jgi:hypothetical protein